MTSLPTALRTARRIWRHPSNRGQRLWRLGLALRLRFAGSRGLLVRYGERSWIHCRHDAGTSRRAAHYRVPDWPEMLVWRRCLRPGDLFVDVGANVGLYTLWALDCGAEAIAIEPVARTRWHLQRNLVASGRDAEVHACALAEASGWAQMAGSDLNRQHLAARSGSEGGDDAVAVRTLDELLGERRVAGVKVDVEGAERLVLLGAGAALAAGRIDLLQLEWNAESRRQLGESRRPLAELLAAHGYGLYRADGGGGLLRDDGLADRFAGDVFARRGG